MPGKGLASAGTGTHEIQALEWALQRSQAQVWALLDGQTITTTSSYENQGWGQAGQN